jgi:hypothetical protein
MRILILKKVIVIYSKKCAPTISIKKNFSMQLAFSILNCHLADSTWPQYALVRSEIFFSI